MEDPMLGGGDVITSAKPKTGFPFDDSDPPTFTRGSRSSFRPFRHHLDDIASRHPEFAEHLRPWTSDFPSFHNTSERHHTTSDVDNEPNSTHSQASSRSSSFGTNTSYPFTSSDQRPEAQLPPRPHTESSHRHNIPNYGLRNTVDLGEKQKQSDLDEKNRNQRSMSAPPDNRSNPTQQRFVSRVNIEPQQPQEPSHMGGNTSTLPNQAKSPESQTQKPNVRHIPIFVEGRDEPILPKNVADQETDSNYRPSPPHYDHQTKFPGFVHKETPKSHHIDDFDQPFPSTFYHPPRTAQPFPGKQFHQQTPSPKVQPQPQVTPIKVQVHQQQPPQQQHQYHQQQQSQPQFQQPQQHHQQQYYQQQQPPPHPQQKQPQQQQEQQQQQQPQQQKPQSNDPIVKIQEVQKDVNELMSLVEKYTGASKKDKQYIYLDEMLTRNLIKLDNIDTQGKDTIRQARKEAIKCIQKCISILESKVSRAMEAEKMEENATVDNSNSSQTTETMECDNEPPVEQKVDENKAAVVEESKENEEKMDTEPIPVKNDSEQQQQQEQQPMQTLEVSGTVKTGLEIKPDSVVEAKPENVETKTENVEQKLENVEMKSENVAADVPMNEVPNPVNVTEPTTVTNEDSKNSQAITTATVTEQKTVEVNTTTNEETPKLSDAPAASTDGQEKEQKKKVKKIVKKKPRSQSTDKSETKPMEVDEVQKTASEPAVNDTSQKSN